MAQKVDQIILRLQPFFNMEMCHRLENLMMNFSSTTLLTRGFVYSPVSLPKEQHNPLSTSAVDI